MLSFVIELIIMYSRIKLRLGCHSFSNLFVFTCAALPNLCILHLILTCHLNLVVLYIKHLINTVLDDERNSSYKYNNSITAHNYQIQYYLFSWVFLKLLCNSSVCVLHRQSQKKLNMITCVFIYLYTIGFN